MKKINKKIVLSVICAVAVIATVLIVGISTRAEKSLEVLDPTLEYTNLYALGIADDTYDTIPAGKEWAIRTWMPISLAGKVVNNDVTFSATSAYLYLGGSQSGHWGAMYLASGQEGYAADSLVLAFGDEKYELKSSVAKRTLVGEKFNLKLSYKIEKIENVDTLKLGVWIDDILYNDQYFYVSTYKNGSRDYTNYLTGYAMIIPAGKNSYVKVESDVPEELNPELERIDLKALGIADGTYQGIPTGSEWNIRKWFDTSLEGKVLNNNITFSSTASALYLGGNQSGHWGALFLASGQDGYAADSLTLGYGDNKYELKSSVAKANLVGESFNLKLSYEVIDRDKDENDDTLKLGVWINNVLYNNQYFYLSTYKDGGRSYTNYLNGWAMIQPYGSNAFLKVESDVPKTLNSKLETIDLKALGIADGTYDTIPAGSEWAIRKWMPISLAGKVINNYVTFSETPAYLYLGGPNNHWSAMYLASGQDGYAADSLVLSLGDEKYELKSSIAKQDLVGTEFNLKLSYEVIDTNNDNTVDTLQLGVWIEDILYNNKYFYVSTYKNGTMNYTNYLTGFVFIVPSGSQSYVKVASDMPKTLNPDLERIDLKALGVPDGIYNSIPAGSEWAIRKHFGESLSGKVINNYITFSSTPAYLYLGGPDNHWSAMYLASGQDGYAADSLVLAFGDEKYELKSSVANQNLVDEEFNLKLSYEVIDKDKDNTVDTLQLGVWINDVLYNNKYFYVSTYKNGTMDYTNYLTGFVFIIPSGTGASVVIRSDAPKTLNPDLERIDLKALGISDGTYNTIPSGSEWAIRKWMPISLAGKVINNYVTFSETPAYLYLGGPNNHWSAMSLASGQDGYASDSLVLSLGDEKYEIKSSVAKQKLVGSEFNLKLSYEVIDTNKDNAVDTLQLGVWIEDVLYDNRYFYVSTYKNGTMNYTNYLTGFVFIVPSGSQSYLKVESDEPKTLNPELEKITLKQLGIADGTYDKIPSGSEWAIRKYFNISLAGKVLSNTVTFSKAPSYLYLGGPDNHWDGMYLASGQDGYAADSLVLCLGDEKYELKSSVAKQNLVEEEFSLKLSYEVLDTDQNDKDDTLQLGVWINDVLYNNKYFYVSTYENGTKSYTTYLSGSAMIIPSGANSYVTITSDVAKILNPKLEQITLNTLGIPDGVYAQVPAGSEWTIRKYFSTYLEDKVLSNYVTFSAAQTYLHIGGTNNHWDAMYLASGVDGYATDSLVLSLGGELYELKSSVAKRNLVGEEFNLKISYEVIDTNQDNKDDSLQLGVWIDGVLYNNKYFYVSTYSNGAKDYTNYLSGFVFIRPVLENSTLKVRADEAKIVNPSLEQVTFEDFGIKNGSYKHSEKPITGSYKNGLAGKVFQGQITLSKEASHFFIGGMPSAEYGITFSTGAPELEEGCLLLTIGDQKYVLNPEVVGTELVGKPIDLKLTYEVVDQDEDKKEDTLKFGVWIKGKLYNDAYFYVSTYQHPDEKYGTRDYKDFLNGYLGIWAEDQNAVVTVASVRPEKLDTSMTKLTFVDFGVKDGTYKGKDKMKIGYREGKMEDSYFSADIIFSKKRADLWIGGSTDAWSGMGILSGYSNDDSVLVFMENGNEHILRPDVAGATLVGEKFNLKLSYQVVGDELKFGIWINDKLYNNEYFYIQDYEKYLGPCLGIYTAHDDSYVTVVSDTKLENPARGSRRPNPPTGDSADVGKYAVILVCSICVLTMVVGSFIYNKKRKGGLE